VAAARNIVAGQVLIGEPSTGAVVQGNYFGTDETGTSALVPRAAFLVIGSGATIGGSEGVTVGGPCTGACNIFANGLTLSAANGEAGNHVVQGNFVGTDVSGTLPLDPASGASWGIGIFDSNDNLIGGTDPAERNLISGNESGVRIGNTSAQNRIVGNFIGTNVSGTGPLPNFEGVACCLFGDDNTIEGNVIAFNRSVGILIEGHGASQGEVGSVGNAILGNSIFANEGIGIDLGGGCTPCADGPTENDARDEDAGPNGHQNFPVITRVTADDGETTIEGTLNSRPDSTYHVELFRNSGCDPSHFGEGETVLRSTNVTTGPTGDASFAVTYPEGLGSTEVVTSTATDARNNTSEFSECLADLSVTKSDDPDPVAVDQPLTYTIEVANHGPAPANEVRLTDMLPADVTVTSITPSQGSCSTLGPTVTCTLGSIGRHATARITIVVDPGSTPRALTNTAAVSSELRDPDESDNSSTATTQVVAALSATIIVRKATVPSPDPTDTSFAFTAGGGLSPASFSLENGESHTFADLVPQAGYSVAEATPAGWDSTSACSNGSPVSNIDVGPGETVTCTFTNTKRGMAKVIKTVNGVPPTGSQSFTFQIRQVASTISAGTILEQQNANAANGGLINFATLLVPGATYQLCEIVMPGWMTTLGPPFFSVFNPSGDNSALCTNFTGQPGELKTFSINNIPPPGGLARTIGFWKNWASCSGSNGNQRPVLDRALAAADPGGIVIGDLILHGSAGNPEVAPDCQKAVRLLKKSRISDGRNMSSDPAFNLAAQLLAAKLNVVAGAGTCPAAVTAINDAQALLDAINFNGNTHLNMTTSQRNVANSLAATLDSYNNDTLC
jgi:uncharacterized repeat protein (TIGR01451 family)